MGWYSILLLVCVIGLGLIVFSRHEREVASENATTTTTTTTQPPAVQPTTSAHWQVALSLDICGKVVNLPRSADQTAGIITSGNGVVDVQPKKIQTSNRPERARTQISTRALTPPSASS